MKLKNREFIPVSEDIRELYPHQEEAINKWFDAGKKGILEMATGTGKTFTSLKCVEKLLDDEENLVTIISCPYAHLVEQWEKDVKSVLDNDYEVLCASLNSNWRKDLMNAVFELELGVKKNAILLTTHNSFSSEKFIEEINRIDNPILLIVD